MRKTTIGLWALTGAVLLSTATLSAANTNNGLAFFFDTRDTMSAALIHGGALGNAKWDGTPINPWKNGPCLGKRGEGQVRFISPVIPSGAHIYTGQNASLDSTFLYMDVEDRFGDGDIISTIGMDMSIVKDSGDMGLDPVTGVAFTIFNTAATVGGGATTDPWNDTTVGPVGVTGITGFKTVRVPVTDVTPVYSALIGLGVGGSYRIAKLDFRGGARGSLPTSVGIYSLKMIVNDLHITRVYDIDGPTGVTPELPDFGYATCAPEQASIPGISGAHGSSQGTTSAVADCTIVVKAKGDFDRTATVDIADITLFVNQFNRFPLGLNTVEGMWSADIDKNNIVDIADISGFINIFNTWNNP